MSSQEPYLQRLYFQLRPTYSGHVDDSRLSRTSFHSYHGSAPGLVCCRLTGVDCNPGLGFLNGLQISTWPGQWEAVPRGWWPGRGCLAVHARCRFFRRPWRYECKLGSTRWCRACASKGVIWRQSGGFLVGDVVLLTHEDCQTAYSYSPTLRFLRGHSKLASFGDV